MLTIPELRDASISYVLYEQTRRKINKKPPTLPSFTDEQLHQFLMDLLKARNAESND